MKKDKTHIHWYPGHIAKAERRLKEQLSLVDAVIEVLDARIPLSSGYDNIAGLLNDKPRLILFNKSDLADKTKLKTFAEKIEKSSGYPVILSDAKNSKDLNQIVKKAVELSEPRIQAIMKKGLLRRPARVMVVGMPNVGKSSIINKLTRSSKTKTGAKAGVTRQQQWVRINPQLELLDTPGIIPMKQENLTAEEETVRKNGLVTVIVLFCASGTGIYGSIISGMNGDNSILFSKSILDFFSVIIFTCAYGAIVKYISIPQFIIFIIIFYLAKVIFPLTTPDMLNDFRAVSGILMIANGFRIMNLKMFPVADMIPAMILVFPLSALWSMIQF